MTEALLPDLPESPNPFFMGGKKELFDIVVITKTSYSPTVSKPFPSRLTPNPMNVSHKGLLPFLQLSHSSNLISVDLSSAKHQSMKMQLSLL